MSMQAMPLGRAVALGVCLTLAAACGGSGSGSPTDPGSTLSEAQVEALSFQLLNQARGAQGVEPELIQDPQLAEVARGYSRQMRDRDFFSHVDPDGHDFTFRLSSAGVAFTVAGENLAFVTNADNPAQFAHDRFLLNPEHRANVLDGRLTHAGVGVARDGSTFWITQLFVRR